MTKAILRKTIKEKISAMSPTLKKQSSIAVCDRLMSLASVMHADSIFAYLPLLDEVDLRPAISLWIHESRTVSIPIVSWDEREMRCGLITSLDDNDLIETRHGIMEPRTQHTLSNDCIDAILVPGVGFDAQGGRLGRGGGFYDRFLASTRPPIVIGICFDEQILDSVPREAHDQPMTVIVTPTNVLIG